MIHRAYLSEGFGESYPWIDVVNSQHWDGFGGFTDHLKDTSWLTLFLRQWDFAELEHLGHEVIAAELTRSRDAMRQLLSRWAKERMLNVSDVSLINEALRVPVHRRFERHATGFRVRIRPREAGRLWLRAQLFESFAATLATADADRIKICPNPGCQWVFYDRTAGNIRKWCRDRQCGNRDRVRRARERERSRR